MLPNINNAPKLTGNSSRLEILKALVDWIQKDEFAVGRKNKKGSGIDNERISPEVVANKQLTYYYYEIH